MSDPITIDDLLWFNLMHEVTDITDWNKTEGPLAAYKEMDFLCWLTYIAITFWHTFNQSLKKF